MVDEEFLCTPGGLRLPLREIEWTAMRSQGPGGQHVNKVSSAVQLRLNLNRCSLPEAVRLRLMGLRDRRISRDGVLLIKAQEYRSQARNRAAALVRLTDLLDRAAQRKKQRLATQPTRAARRRRLDRKKQRGDLKKLRRKPCD